MFVNRSSHQLTLTLTPFTFNYCQFLHSQREIIPITWLRLWMDSSPSHLAPLLLVEAMVCAVSVCVHCPPCSQITRCELWCNRPSFGPWRLPQRRVDHEICILNVEGVCSCLLILPSAPSYRCVDVLQLSSLSIKAYIKKKRHFQKR